MEDIKKEIDKLIDVLNYHSDLYYNKNTSEISDAEWDNLYIKLQELESKYPEYCYDYSPTQKVNCGNENTFEKTKHSKPMISLGKCMDYEQLFKWLKTMFNDNMHFYCVEPKMDGLGLSLRYSNGKLLLATTRGNGIIGENVTTSAINIDCIPKYVSEKRNFEVRGEIILLKDGLAEINKEKEVYKNVRNAASGILRTKKPIKKLCDKLVFAAYTFISDDIKIDTHYDSMSFLKNNNFTLARDLIKDERINDCLLFTINNDYELEETIKKIENVFDIVSELRDNINFDIDGMVIKLNNYSDQKKLGEKVNIPNWATAYKFESKKAITKLSKVEWSLGNKGNLTPRAFFDNPVDIGGSSISKCTLHNIEELKRLNIKLNDNVLVEKRGDVIPKITKVYEELRTGDEKDIVIPDKCPECGNELSFNGTFLRCDNKDCSGRLQSKIENFINALEIKGFGVKIVEKLISLEKINNIYDIFYLTKQDFMEAERIGDKLAEKLILSIEKGKHSELYKFIAGFTIKNVSTQTAKDICCFINNDINKFMTIKYDELISINGIGETIAENIIEWLSFNDHVIKEIIKLDICFNNNNESKSNILNGKKFAFTGALLHYKRKEIEQMINENGGEVFGIKKGLDYLILGSNGKEEKVKKAQNFGAWIITEETFLKMLEGN